MSLILTRAALALKNPSTNFEVVKFESYKPKKKQTTKNEKSGIETTRQQFYGKDVDLKKIRHEVVKFGMSGFDPTRKEEAKIALAVSLGAKPPKRKYVNYKELMQKRKEEKLREKEEKQQMVSKTILQNVSKKKKNKGTQNDVGHFLSGYGKVQKKDLKKNEQGKKTKKRKQ